MEIHSVQKHTKVLGLHPCGTVDVYTKIHSNLSGICGSISVWTKLVGQMTNTASVSSVDQNV